MTDQEKQVMCSLIAQVARAAKPGPDVEVKLSAVAATNSTEQNAVKPPDT